MRIFLVNVFAGEVAHQHARQVIINAGAENYEDAPEFRADGVQDPYRAVDEADAVVWLYQAQLSTMQLSPADYNRLYGDSVIERAIRTRKPVLFYRFHSEVDPPLPSVIKLIARSTYVSSLEDFVEKFSGDIYDLMNGKVRCEIPFEAHSSKAIENGNPMAKQQETPEWDVFISHASEDKSDVARPLADLLASRNLRIWLDEAELFLGDSLRAKIDEGLAHSHFGVVVLSPHFFQKNWPKAELDGLISKDSGERPVILPVWHNITFDQVREKSPLLAARVAAKTERGLREVAQQIVAAIESHGRPLRPHSPIFAGRLTKGILMSLPEGSFLQSNIRYLTDRTPGIAETLGDAEARKELWFRIRKSGIAGTLFYAYRDADAYRRRMAILRD